MAAGCATVTEPTPTGRKAVVAPEEEIRAAMEDFVAAFGDEDVERALTWISDNYIDPQGYDKSWVRESWTASQGAFASVKIRMNDCKIAVTGDSAVTKRAVTIEYEYPGGTPSVSVGVGYEWKREEDGVWRIVTGGRHMADDPWETVNAILEVGDVVTGHITHVTDFGIFVKLTEGIEGLVHVSEISNEKTPTPVGRFSVSDSVTVKVMVISQPERRIGLSIRRLTDGE